MATFCDDTYTGPRWRYGLQHRPISSYFLGRDGSARIPHPILFSHRQSRDPRFPHGTADWPVELPEEEARHHSLVLIGRVEDGHVECPTCAGAGRVRVGPRRGCYITTEPCRACDSTGWADQEAFHREYPGEPRGTAGIDRHLAAGGSEPE
jgi:hypothetical protein